MAGEQEIFDELTSGIGAEAPANEPPAEPAPSDQEQQQSGPARDEHGRFAARQTEEPEGTSEQPQPVEDEPKRHHVPLSEYLSEREKRQAFERRAEEAERERQRYERELAQARQPKREPQPPPNILDDPDGYANHVRQTIRAEMVRERLDASFDDAREQHGEAFDKAFSSLMARVDAGDTRLRAEIVNAPNPGRALMRWHRQQEALREIGDDPTAYKTKLRQELLSDEAFRKEAMAAWGAQPAAGQTDRPNVTGLPSVNGATGARSGAAGADSSDARVVFQSIAGRLR